MTISSFKLTKIQYKCNSAVALLSFPTRNLKGQLLPSYLYLVAIDIHNGFTNSWTSFTMFSFSSFVYVKNANNNVAISCSKYKSYKEWADTHFTTTFWSETEKVKNRCSCDIHVWLLKYRPLLEPISVYQFHATNNAAFLRHPVMQIYG